MNPADRQTYTQRQCGEVARFAHLMIQSLLCSGMQTERADWVDSRIDRESVKRER